MKIPFLDIKRQHSGIIDLLNEKAHHAIESGWYIGGTDVSNFEDSFASYLHVGNCVTCGNGTDALELVLRALGVGIGDEVIIPSFTWVSDAEVVHAVGATPRFAEIDGNSFNITAETIRPLINDKTKVIIAVHLYGLSCNMESIMKLANEHGIKVIEDCAQAHGAIYRGNKVGTIAHAGTFSFYPTKNLGALGDGGAITTNDTDLAAQIRLIKDHGQKGRDNHQVIGRNSRLDPIQAMFLNEKLKYLDDWNAERGKIANRYLAGLADTSLILPEKDPDRVWHLFVVRTHLRNEIKDYLDKHGVSTAIHYPKAIHQIPAYNQEIELPESEKAAEEVLSLPLFPGLTDVEIDYTVSRIRDFFNAII